MENLSFEESVFIDSFVRTGDLRESYNVAFRSAVDPIVALREADVLLKTPYIQSAIKEIQNKVDEIDPLDEKYVKRNLRRIVERCMVSEPVRDKDGIPTGEYQFNASGATKALELIGKNLKMFTDNLNVNSDGVEPLVEALNAARNV